MNVDTVKPAADGSAAIGALFMRAALEAGAEIMAVYAEDGGHRLKADRSPVTVADERAEIVICRHLEAGLPGVPIVAEEAISAGKVPPALGARFLLVDPLDGTKEFINRRSDFTVNIALVEDGVPTHGVVFAPATGRIYLASPGDARTGTAEGLAPPAGWQPITVRPAADRPVAVASRSHRSSETDAFLAANDITDCVSVGSSLKFCLLAEGQADVYPRFGRTMEWDTAAGDAVLRAAGGCTCRRDGARLIYGKRDQADDVDFANPPFVAYGGWPVRVV